MANIQFTIFIMLLQGYSTAIHVILAKPVHIIFNTLLKYIRIQHLIALSKYRIMLGSSCRLLRLLLQTPHVMYE